MGYPKASISKRKQVAMFVTKHNIHLCILSTFLHIIKYTTQQKHSFAKIS